MSNPDHQTGLGRRPLAGLIALICVSGALLWAARSQEVDTTVDASAMGWIQYEKEGQVVRLEGSEAGWHVASPYEAAADREVITWMREAFLALDDTWVPLAGAVKELDVYGLGDGAVTLTGGIGAETVHEWRVGDPLVTGEGS